MSKGNERHSDNVELLGHRISQSTVSLISFNESIFLLSDGREKQPPCQGLATPQ